MLENSRFFDVQYTKLLENYSIDDKVLKILINHFVSYVSYFSLSDEQVSAKHMEFLNEYSLHLREFEKTGKFPYQNKMKTRKKRLDYDIPLLCSTFLSYPRYCIFETLHNKINLGQEQNVLVVGVGPGIELATIKDTAKDTLAYDTDITVFIQKTFPGVRFVKESFVYKPDKLYHRIILMELLEHLQNPGNLLIETMKSLKPEGRIHFTTAVNVPQFDHLYNFALNDKNIEKWLLTNACEIEYKMEIPHNYSIDVKAYTCYYIIKRINAF